MRKFIKEYFTLTRSERNGLLVLLFLLILSILFPVIYDWVVPREELRVEIVPFETNTDVDTAHAGSKAQSLTTAPTPFDPNRLERSGWLALGVDPTTVSNILKYRAAGGQFYEKTDLLKISTMEKETFLRLEPYIQLEQSSGWESRYAAHRSIQMVDLNKGDTADFKQLPGIGPVYSKRIIAYRESVGGFDSLTQLTEVYGVDQELFDQIQEYLHISPKEQEVAKTSDTLANMPPPALMNLNEVDSATLTQVRGIGPYFAAKIISHRTALGGFHSLDQLHDIYHLDSTVIKGMRESYVVDGAVQKLNLNTASVKELSRHPYISKALAEFIVSYRLDHIRINELDELLSSYLVDEELLLKIAPYIEL
jgi:DNA uptake protein ComE-like DNA-binding protein